MSRTAIVTGASRGIGRGIATVLAREGYDLCISYRSEAGEAQAVQEELEAACGVKCHVVQASLEDPAVPVQLARRAIELLGHVDLLVNNAGVTRKGAAHELQDAVLDHLINLNFRAYIVLMREISAHMVAAGIRGSIVHITSSRGQRAYPGDGIYGGLKAAVHRAAQSAALDLAPFGIRVNCVAPGATRVCFGPATDEASDILGRRIPLGRLGLPEDVGYAVAFLASDRASYITGEVLRVDGGLILPGMPERRDYPGSWT